MTCVTPNRSLLINQSTSSPIFERSLLINKQKNNIRNCFIWGGLNVAFLSILLYDLSHSCPLYVDFYTYLEYGLIVILTINIFYYLIKILLGFKRHEQITINQEQKKLLGVKDADPNYKIVDNLTLTMTLNTSLSTPPPSNRLSTPLNATALSWRSSLSPNDSLNYSIQSQSWIYAKNPTPDYSKQTSPKFSSTTPVSKSTYRDTSSVEQINDEDSLNKFLKEHEEAEKSLKITNKIDDSTNLLSSFWSHPVAKTSKDLSSFLKKCQYQLSSQSPSKAAANTGNKMEDGTGMGNQTAALEVWTRINVDIVALTQWNENLRMWISQTILERLVKEFDRINDSLEKHGLTDIKIGCVGLDRLRKAAQMVQVAQFIPSLATLIPFLEVTPNQEYLVKRIRELAKAGCMSEFKWNGGSSFNGKEWDDSLPTDCAIVMHLLASYLDTQLMPMPNMPDAKPFSGHHYIKATDKMPDLTPKSLFIHQVSEKPPHYRVIVGEKVYEMVKGYNNLFHSILFFIYHVNKVEHGMLGRVNLGKAGVNILWIIDQ